MKKRGGSYFQLVEFSEGKLTSPEYNGIICVDRQKKHPVYRKRHLGGISNPTSDYAGTRPGAPVQK